MAFVVGAWLALRSLQDDVDKIDWSLIAVVALVGVPAAILLNALEYREMGRLRAVEIPVVEAARTAVLGTAANMMPFPGGVVVRSGDLIARGVTPRDSLKLNVLAGIYSIAIAGVITLALFFGDPLGLVAGAVMVFASVVTVGVLMRDLPGRATQIRLLSIEIAIVVVTATRGWLIMDALGASANWGVAFGIASVYPVAALVGIFPGGLALREALAGLVTRSLGSGASIGFLVAAIDRLIGLVVHAPIALMLARRQSPKPFVGGNS